MEANNNLLYSLLYSSLYSFYLDINFTNNVIVYTIYLCTILNKKKQHKG